MKKHTNREKQRHDHDHNEDDHDDQPLIGLMLIFIAFMLFAFLVQCVAHYVSMH